MTKEEFKEWMRNRIDMFLSSMPHSERVDRMKLETMMYEAFTKGSEFVKRLRISVNVE